MTLAEFKAWLEGYSASFKDGAPNADQWEAIKEKIGKVTPVDLSPPTHLGRGNPIWIAPSKDLPPVTPYYSPTVVPPAPEWVNPVVTCQ